MDLFEFAIPQDIKDLTLPDPSEVNYWNLRYYRTFWIDFDIDESQDLLELAKEIIAMNIKEKDVENPKPIYLYIHSYGGDLYQALFFCDLIQSSRIPIVTISAGVSMSAGFLIFISGVRRYVFKHTQLMIHEGSASFQGTAQQIEDAQKSYKRNIDRMKDYIISKTNIDAKLFNKNKNNDWYVSGEEILKYGIADKIINSFLEII
jgi:ATP-dependent Clp protease protease subunit